jgi:hypothetical protein
MQFRLTFVASMLFGAAASVGCASSAPPRATAALPAYTMSEAAIFDDLLSPALFQTSFLTHRASDDRRFGERAVRAEAVWLVRVATISREGGESSTPAYSLVLEPLEAVVGPALNEPIPLTIPVANPSFRWLDVATESWMGMRFLLLARRYQGEGGGVEVHFRGEPDTPQVRERILLMRQAAHLLR